MGNSIASIMVRYKKRIRIFYDSRIDSMIYNIYISNEILYKEKDICDLWSHWGHLSSYSSNTILYGDGLLCDHNISLIFWGLQKFRIYISLNWCFWEQKSLVRLESWFLPISEEFYLLKRKKYWLFLNIDIICYMNRRRFMIDKIIWSRMGGNGMGDRRTKY